MTEEEEVEAKSGRKMPVDKSIMETLSLLVQARNKMRNIIAEISTDRLDRKEVIEARIDRVQELLEKAKEAIGEKN